MICLLSSACDFTQPQIEADLLRNEKPFGFDWNRFAENGDLIGEGHWEECRKLAAQLKLEITAHERDVLVTICANDKTTSIYIANELVPPAFKLGDIGVVLRGDSEPVTFTYSYLHRLVGSDLAQDKMRRKRHASKIRRTLTEMYGEPAERGVYQQFSSTGFVVSDDKYAPCEYWLIDSVGIMLCAERVVLIDGIEMSLSFTRLDRVPFGDLLRCVIEAAIPGDCHKEANQNESESGGGGAEVLKILVDWLGPNSFRNCNSGDLKPLEEVWALPKEEEDKLSAVLETKFGDDLAEYAFNLHSENVDDIPHKDLTKIIMYLIKLAAEQGSASAMNEIGASLLYCYQDVQQDTELARRWLEKAADAGDAFAMKSLAFMHVLGMTGEASGREKAVEMLEKCSMLDADACSKELYALNRFMAVQ